VDDTKGASWPAPTDQELLDILRSTRTIAVVGASVHPGRAGHFVPLYLLAESDYQLMFVNPNATEILDQPVYPSLADLPVRPDMVDVFRRSSALPAVAEAAIAIGASTLWLQSGLSDVAVAERAHTAGLKVVMDRCLKIEHARLRPLL
jgi:predicted CoA-binding protein